MVKIICILLPLLGAAYGVFVGTYIRSTDKSPVKKMALLLSGILLVSFIIGLLIYVFNYD